MWYDIEWVRWLLHVVGVAVGVFIGRSLLGGPARYRLERTTYVVCPRCGRSRRQRYRMGGDTTEEG